MGAGSEFVKKIRPIGCILFLMISVYFLVFCFTSGKNPIPGYVAPHDSTYYSQNADTLSELKTELETNVFPKLTGIKDCQIVGGKLEITIDSLSFFRSRTAILKFYDRDLFTFIKSE
jgi:hypothetical protein